MAEREPSWRFVEAMPGMRCWMHGYTLDRRISAHSRGEILSFHKGGWHLEVKVGTQQRTVTIEHVDCGREWKTKRGEWIPETDERVHQWLLKALAEPARLRDFRSPDGRGMSLEDVQWILRRNGWEVPKIL